MLNNEVKKNIRIKITIKRIRTLFEKKKKTRGQPKIFNWIGKLKKKIKLTNESKIQIKRIKTKLKK